MLKANRDCPEYRMGRKAYADQQTYRDNPFPSGEQHTQWGFGWLEAKNAVDQDAMQKMLSSLESHEAPN